MRIRFRRMPPHLSRSVPVGAPALRGCRACHARFLSVSTRVDHNVPAVPRCFLPAACQPHMPPGLWAHWERPSLIRVSLWHAKHYGNWLLYSIHRVGQIHAPVECAAGIITIGLVVVTCAAVKTISPPVPSAGPLPAICLTGWSCFIMAAACVLAALMGCRL